MRPALDRLFKIPPVFWGEFLPNHISNQTENTGSRKPEQKVLRIATPVFNILIHQWGVCTEATKKVHVSENFRNSEIKTSGYPFSAHYYII